MLETRKNDQHVRNERIHVGRNKTRRESSAAKRSTYRRNTHHRSRATSRHCIHAMTARVRKRRVPTRGRTHTPPTGGIQAVSGEREVTQQPPPNEQHSHAAPDRQRRAPPNPARPHPRKTRVQHPKPYKPLYLSSSIYQPRATDAARGHKKRAHTPARGYARDADKTYNSTPTLTPATATRAATWRDTPHKRARVAPPTNGHAQPQILYLHVAGQTFTQ